LGLLPLLLLGLNCLLWCLVSELAGGRRSNSPGILWLSWLLGLIALEGLNRRRWSVSIAMLLALVDMLLQRWLNGGHIASRRFEGSRRKR